MPRYKVLKKGFFGGKLYDPNGKRRVLHTAKPYPKSTKGLKKGQAAAEQVPSWLERLPDESPADEQKRRDEEEEAKRLEAEKLENDQKDIADASFMGEGESADANGVETL
eukprot:GHVR01169303.1.p2 GENE.GHVR01169303.1~~GHVR01169303.1.p2  ORF type:complete len:110 (-),score=22.55 GHVR01169303.1:473-802(-)